MRLHIAEKVCVLVQTLSWQRFNVADADCRVMLLKESLLFGLLVNQVPPSRHRGAKKAAYRFASLAETAASRDNNSLGNRVPRSSSVAHLVPSVKVA
jgi:hypothetical protein